MKRSKHTARYIIARDDGQTLKAIASKRSRRDAIAFCLQHYERWAITDYLIIDRYRYHGRANAWRLTAPNATIVTLSYYQNRKR